MGCDVTQQLDSSCYHWNICFRLDPFFRKEIRIEDENAAYKEVWQCQIECQKLQECDFWTLYHFKGYDLLEFLIMLQFSMSGIFRYIKCLLYDFPYPILPEEMIKQKAPEDVITCNSGSKYCCMFER